jgi:hypothetical protein
VEERPQLTTGDESLHDTSNDNGIIVVNLATPVNLVLKSTLFPRHRIYKYTWILPNGKTVKLIMSW